MSRRKDRERFLAMKGLNPDYVGFRGDGTQSAEADAIPLEGITCSVCNRRRNVPVGVAIKERENYICSTCQEDQAINEPLTKES